ncbi:hypothetical protein D3C87_1834100 [compost metagenome]
MDVVSADLQPNIDLNRRQNRIGIALAIRNDLRPLIGAEIMDTKFCSLSKELEHMADRSLSAVVRADEDRNVRSKIDHDVAQSAKIAHGQLL